MGGSECGDGSRARSDRAPLELNCYFKRMSKPGFPVEGGDWMQHIFNESVSVSVSVFL